MVKQKKGFFTVTDNVCHTGTHLLLELWGASRINSIKNIEKALNSAVKAINATLLELRLHHFSPNKGVTGIAIVSESHISIHTWPEFDYAAVDIFVCGNVDPYKAIPVFKKHFTPQNIQISEIKRGILG